MSWITAPLSHLATHNTSWRPLMGVTTMTTILPLVEMKRARRLKKVMKLNWVHSLITASDTELTISMIERLSKDWTSPIYVFFRTLPRIEYVDGRHAHIFECAAGRCQGKNGRDIHWYLDKGDAKSTSGLRQHATKCWGAETVKSADGTKDLEAAHAVLLKTKLHDGTIMAKFEHIGRGKVTYSHRQHTSTESRYETYL